MWAEGTGMLNQSPSRRRLAIAVATCFVGASAVGWAQAAAAQPRLKRTEPAVTHLRATPSVLKHAGGSVRLTAKTSGATKCRVTASVALKGLPTTIGCKSGKPALTVPVPANNGDKVRSIEFSLRALGSHGTYAEESRYVQVLPPPASITSFSAAPSDLSSAGGKVRLRATTTRATTCVLAVSPKLKGLPRQLGCSGGKLTKLVKLPAATSGSATEYAFVLVALGPGGSAPTGETAVQVTGKKPSVTKFSASPSKLPSAGGVVKVSVTVADATECSFGYRWEGGGDTVGGKWPHDIACSSGTYSFKVTVKPNTTKFADRITFELNAISEGGTHSAKKQPVVTEAAAG
jgi:hypothetical protein